MSTISKTEALALMEKYSNQTKRTYVRVADRICLRDQPVEGTAFILRQHTNVYSKTWSKTVVILMERMADGKLTRACADVRGARKLLAS